MIQRSVAVSVAEQDVEPLYIVPNQHSTLSAGAPALEHVS
jgi:hypothetical protein